MTHETAEKKLQQRILEKKRSLDYWEGRKRQYKVSSYDDEINQIKGELKAMGWFVGILFDLRDSNQFQQEGKRE